MLFLPLILYEIMCIIYVWPGMFAVGKAHGWGHDQNKVPARGSSQQFWILVAHPSKGLTMCSDSVKPRENNNGLLHFCKMTCLPGSESYRFKEFFNYTTKLLIGHYVLVKTV